MPNTEHPEPTPPRTRRRLLMTKADWERVERDVRKAEREPDPAQLDILDQVEA